MESYFSQHDHNLAGALVVGGLVHALPGASFGGKVAHGHEGGAREPLAARVCLLVLGER